MNSHRFTKRSPAQIRQMANLAIRNRVRAKVPDLAMVVRAPDPGETPLSVHEIAVGVQSGVIRTARVRVHLAEEAEVA